jgi:pimeloyl-ACP methyl ester carboxylesterase/quercetin dioxygenase-like cupin family protein
MTSSTQPVPTSTVSTSTLSTSTLSTSTVTIDGLGPVAVTFYDSGGPSGSDRRQSVLLLHGGAGPLSVAGFADLLSADARVIVPVHPGFDGTPRPEQLTGIRPLAAVYSQLIRDLGLSDVCVIGNSVGGWIAAEIALAESAAADSPVRSVVLVDAAGLLVDAAPVPEVSRLTPDQIAQLSYFSPEKYRIDPATMTDAQRTARTANFAALAAYGGSSMADPALLDRLPAIRLPVLVIWGAADRMIPVEHGRAYAAAIPGAQFALLERVGHLPQLEAPEELRAAIADFVAQPGPRRMTVSVVSPEAGDVALNGPVRLRILEDGSTTSHRLGVAEITIAPHTAGPPQHRHARHDEGFYVVAGTAQFTVGNETHIAGQGTFVMIPPGAPHTFANASDEPVVLLNTFTPDLYVQYFRDLRAMLAASEAQLTPQAIVETMARYGTEPATEYASG